MASTLINYLIKYAANIELEVVEPDEDDKDTEENHEDILNIWAKINLNEISAKTDTGTEKVEMSATEFVANGEEPISEVHDETVSEVVELSEEIENIIPDVIVETHFSAPQVVVIPDEDTSPKLMLTKGTKRAAPIEFHFPNGSILTKDDLDKLDPKVMSNDGWLNDNLIETLSPLLVKNLKGIKLSDYNFLFCRVVSLIFSEKKCDFIKNKFRKIQVYSWLS